jgi:hypothetical protein
MSTTIKNSKSISVGQHIVIPKGTKIRTTHPKGNRISKRNQTIKIYDIYPSYKGHPAEIVWPGSAGYWCYAVVDDILREGKDETLQT